MSALSPDDYATSFHTSLAVADMNRPRSLQTDGGILGGSDAGQCTHKAVLTVQHATPTNLVKKGSARIGTALHAAFLEDTRALFPHRLIEQTLTATLPSGTEIPLHPDEIDPTEPSICDYKFVADIDLRRRVGVTDQQHMQRNLQALAAIQAGLVAEQDLIVRNLFVSMTDADDVWVQQEPFSMDWVRRADDWYANVRYAVAHDEEGAKDAQPYFCTQFCPFYDRCKPPLLDAMGELTSPGLREAVLTAQEAVAERKHWAAIEKQAKEQLKGISGRVGSVQIIATWVNSGAGYYKTDFREIS